MCPQVHPCNDGGYVCVVSSADPEQLPPRCGWRGLRCGRPPGGGGQMGAPVLRRGQLRGRVRRAALRRFVDVYAPGRQWGAAPAPGDDGSRAGGARVRRGAYCAAAVLGRGRHGGVRARRAHRRRGDCAAGLRPRYGVVGQHRRADLGCAAGHGRGAGSGVCGRKRRGWRRGGLCAGHGRGRGGAGCAADSQAGQFARRGAGGEGGGGPARGDCLAAARFGAADPRADSEAGRRCG